jgi:isopentenyldiphosphate isomerase
MKRVTMPVVSEDMILDAVNQADVPIGLVKREDVFATHAGFRVAHVLVFNSRGRLLIQRLAPSRKRNPGAWGSSVAAYLFASENYQAAAARRVTEELGVTATSLTFVGKTSMMDDGCLKFISVFMMRSDGPFLFDHSHIAEIEFAPPPQIQEMINNCTRQFTPTFLHVFQYFGSTAR